MRITSSTQHTVVGVYKHLDGIVHAIRKVKATPYKASFQVYSPIPSHDIEHALHEPRSAVRWFSLAGTTFGATGGLGFALYTSWYWGYYLTQRPDAPSYFLGGKPPFSFQPFVVVGFEMFILFGALVTLLGAILLTKVFFRLDTPGYDERFSQDHFGICVQCDGKQIAEVQKMLQECDAAEVRVEKEEVFA